MIHTLDLTKAIDHYAKRLNDLSDLIPLLEKASGAKYVLLGESTHGTSEFYSIRSEISKWLIKEKGFQFIAVEGDWSSCYEVNRFIKGYDTPYTHASESLSAFNRWPEWMWANEEIASFVSWLQGFNNEKDTSSKIGFHGIDIYSLWESMSEIVSYLESIQSPDVEKAKKAFNCFEPYHNELQMYGVSASFYGKDCLDELVDLLKSLHQNRTLYEQDAEAALNLELNSLVVDNAENYYRVMVTDGNESWNIRDRHMVEAFYKVSSFYGKDAKGIIWEHNTHIGDARATDMAEDGMVNVGQLTREKYGEEQVYAVGLGTYKGTVIAADRWGDPHEEMVVPKAQSGSWEYYLHQAGSYDKFILFNQENIKFFNKTIGHRAIGVTYNHRYEHLGNYVPSRLSERYNAFIYIDQTNALRPLKNN
ncbi:erythromycin esterase family protein [Halalkalibacter alkalisediminis]|uniref:Erythromycin esterase family protein n=1 Tax=Halalkalibacter alkalisediminis TaxID=935616 RepID=A0ABV6NGU6_9BACI|nr:erythromycin esterase family protein [Halalkalibacter alkalisediminis]